MNRIIGKKAIKVIVSADCFDVSTARNGEHQGLRIEIVEPDTSREQSKIVAAVIDATDHIAAEVSLGDLIDAVKKVVKKAIKANKKAGKAKK